MITQRRLIEIILLVFLPLLLVALTTNEIGIVFVATIIFLLVFTTIAANYKIGFYLLALSIFWGKPIVLGTLIITLTDIIIVIMTIIFIFDYLMSVEKLKPIAFAKPIALFIIICMLSINQAEYKGESFKELIQIFELYVLLNLICRNKLDEKIIKNVGIIFIAGTTLHSLLFLSDEFYEIGRFYGTIGAMTPYVISFAILLIYCLWLFGNHTMRLKSILFLCGLINIITLLSTHVRSAWIAFVVGIFVISFVKRVKYGVAAILIVTILVSGFLLLPGLPPVLLERFESFVNPDYRFNLTRLVLLKNGINAFLDSPLLGIGIKNLGEVGLKFWDSTANVPSWSIDDIVKFKAGAHNLWLTLLAETGIVGFVIYSWLIYMIIKECNFCRKKAYSDSDKVISVFLYSFFLVFVIVNNFTTFQAYTGGTIFLIILFNTAVMMSDKLKRNIPIN